MPSIRVIKAGDRECWRFPKYPKRITNIQQQVLHKWRPLFVAVAFPNRLLRPELQAVFIGNHTGSNILFRLHRYMRFNLLSEPPAIAAAR